MKDKPKISDAEWCVMNILWENSPLSANQVVEQLEKKTDWKPKTIKTLINRLVSKGALGFEKKGRQHLYYPLLSQDQCVLAETQSFLEKITTGAMKPMLAAFIEQNKLTDDEIKELKKLLEEKKGG
jgi:BlaI family transcriptional regulator, penicillinase repressor